MEAASVPHVLREYALVADGERGALVGPRGDLAWLCFPSWESDALFSSLIGGGGSYAIQPSGRFVWGGYYEPGGLIWRSRWVTDDGAIVECRDALALPAAPRRGVVLRRILARQGRAKVEVRLDVRGRFGRARPRDVERSDFGLWHGTVDDIAFTWSGGGDATASEGALRLELDLTEGTSHDLVLVLASDGEATLPDVDEAWSATEEAWRESVPALESVVAERDARHAIAVISGLTSGGGGTVAAATMSLPERATAGRNYDYRFVWIRDQCLIGQAAAAAQAPALLDGSVRFVCDRLLEHGRHLRPVYTTRGGEVPDEHHLNLPGYPGGSDIAGNKAHAQFQLDIFGEALLLLAAAPERLDGRAWQAAAEAATAIEARWREPDAGIWELDPDEWTHSRLVCAAGLRALAALPEAGSRAPRWLALADALTADCSARCVHPSGRWQRSPGDPRVDAALVAPAIRGALPPDDPRTQATLAAVVAELTEDGFVYRYRPDRRPLGEAEGAFLLCGLLLALAFVRQGNAVEAMRWFERSRTACGPPGLLSEEFDVRQRQLRGNLPQAFVHATLLECAVELDRLLRASPSVPLR